MLRKFFIGAASSNASLRLVWAQQQLFSPDGKRAGSKGGALRGSEFATGEKRVGGSVQRIAGLFVVRAGVFLSDCAIDED